MSGLPQGTVTVVLTEVAGAAALWEHDSAAMASSLDRLDDLVRHALDAHGGHLVKPRMEGESHFLAFERAPSAVACAHEIVASCWTTSWPDATPIRVKAAVHTGYVELRDGDYYGSSVIRCARLKAAGHPGQVLLTDATATAAQAGLPSGCSLRPLGVHWLRDLARPEQVHQLDSPRLPGEHPALTSAPAPRHRLPLPLTPLLGRDRLLADLDVASARTRLLTLWGPPGVGKSRLAVELAALQLDIRGTHVEVIDCGSEPVALDRLAGAFTELPPAAVVVLDDADPVLPAAAGVVAILAARRPDVLVVAAARRPLGLPGEAVVAVPALPVPDGGGGDVDGAAAYRLFAARASAARPSLRLEGEQLHAAIEICRRLEGNPLAIELAAGRAAALAPTQIASRLDRAGSLLAGTSRGGPDHHRSLAAAVGWSVDLLDDGARRLLDGLAVMEQPVTVAAAQAAARSAGAGGSALARLADASFVVEEPGTGGSAWRVPAVVRLALGGEAAGAGVGPSTP